MPTGYTYDIWDGKKIIGQYTLLTPILGKGVNIIFKESYNKNSYDSIIIPLAYLTEDNGVSYTVTRVLDVRRKSKRQKKLICGQEKIQY